MKTFKKIIATLFLFGAIGNLSSCDKEDDPGQTPADPLILSCDMQGSGRFVAEDSTFTLVDRGTGVDYIVDCVMYIAGDFTINPGVTIQFGTDAGISVASTGSIQVLGSANNQVVFTAEDKIPGAWKGVFIRSLDVKNRIEHATIEYAGGGSFNSNGDLGAVIIYSYGLLDMNNTTISNSKSYGFNARYGEDELTLHNNTITNCEAPMYVLATYLNSISGGSYTGNDLDAIIADRDFIIENHTWNKLDVPYHFPSGVDVTPGGNLTVMPGVVMKFGQDTRMYINEGASGPKPSLIAVGTATEPIVFTSIDDVTSGWRGIFFDSPNVLNEIGFARIENGTNADQDGAIETWYDTVLNVHDVAFENIPNCAIYQYIFANDPNTLTTSNLTYTNVTNTICNN